MEKVLIFACLTWASLTFNACYAQNPEQYLPTFNIARDKEVTVNATCGGDLGGQTETYCKLVGYDSFFVKSSNQILSGQVNFSFDMHRKVFSHLKKYILSLSKATWTFEFPL